MTAGRVFPPSRRIDVGDISLAVHEAGPADGPPVVFCHGWPELAYSWKDQVAALADAGFRAIAPDMRGFGVSDAPADVAAYGIDHLVGDVVGLLDALEVEQAIFCGHDWGGIVVWHAAMLARDRVAGVIGVNTPHLPRGERPPTDGFRAFAGDDHYVVRFQEEGVPEAVFEGREDAFFEFIFGPPPPAAVLDHLPPSVTHLLKRFEKYDGQNATSAVVPAEDRAVFAEAFRKSGFHGGINWYRNFDANWRRMEGVDPVVTVPCLMISAECDIMLPPKFTQWMGDLCPDLEKHVLPGIGHWTQWEASDALNRLMLDWLTRRFRPLECAASGADMESMTDERVYYAIGDVHGERGKLHDLHAAIFEDWAVLHGGRQMTLVHLGDYVDRGPDSRGVIERIRALEADAAARDDFDVVNLKGNHEQMLLDAVANFPSSKWTNWLFNGGDATLTSYEGDATKPPNELIDPAHIDWMRGLPSRSVSPDGRLVFVHAGISPQSYPECPEAVRLWTRSWEFFEVEAWPEREELADILVVHGHTPTDGDPDVKPRRINVDTGACFGGPLTAVVLAPEERPRFLRA